MIPKVKYIILIFAFACMVILIYSCALQLPPGGGEIDKVPPKIVEVYPPDGTTNFQDDYFTLEFSKYVDKRSVKDAIFISPPIDGSLYISWTNKSLEADFPAKLKADVTYNITIGTDVVDLNNKNRMAAAYTFAFSTGNKIDNCSITGQVYNDKPSGIMIYAYKIIKDTINPGKYKADYISQCGTDGKYNLSRLAEGTYRVFAVNDLHRDLIFQADQDQIGMPYKDVTLTNTDTLFKGLNFVLTDIDTIPPRLFNAVMTDRNHILLTLSEDIDTSSIKAKNFQIYDSTAFKTIPLLYAFKGRTKDDEIVLSLNDSIYQNHNYYLWMFNISDKSSNIIPRDAVSLTVSDRPDTTAPVLYNVTPAKGSIDVDFLYPSFTYCFDDGFDFEKLKGNVFVSDTSGKPVNFSVNKIDDASFRIDVLDKLKPEKYYMIKLNQSSIVDAAGNKTDTISVNRFRTVSGIDFTGLSGKVINVDVSKNPIVLLQSIDLKGLVYQQKLKKDSTFEFTRISAGKYNLVCFLDENNNGKYDYGYTFPFRPAEKIKYYKNEISLPPRWAVTDLEFDFEK
jgi:uncharacterized protein (DUF2141 family)